MAPVFSIGRILLSYCVWVGVLCAGAYLLSRFDLTGLGDAAWITLVILYSIVNTVPFMVLVAVCVLGFVLAGPSS